MKHNMVNYVIKSNVDKLHMFFPYINQRSWRTGTKNNLIRVYNYEISSMLEL